MTDATGNVQDPSDLQGRGPLDPIELCGPGPNWLEMFMRERTLLLKALGHLAISIDHLGSTAVPGLKAKPVIDLLVSVKRPEPMDVRPKLESLGYVHVPIDAKDRLFFRKGMPRTHHLHLVELGGDERERHLRFRDRLIAHPEEAKEYALIKGKLAKRYRHDREAYTRGKDEFIQDILGR